MRVTFLPASISGKNATYRVTFLLQPTLCLLGCLILVRIHEPKSASVRTVIGAMRSMRQIGTLLGLSFLVNYTFLRQRKKQPDISDEVTEAGR